MKNRPIPNKRTRRLRPGMKALREIREHQKSTKLLIPRASFSRLVCETIQLYRNDYRIGASAITCLQESVEMMMVRNFEDANLCALHRNRITVTPKDWKLAITLNGFGNNFNEVPIEKVIGNLRDTRDLTSS